MVPCLKGYGPQRGCQSARGSNVSRVSSEPSGRINQTAASPAAVYDSSIFRKTEW
jgi:hypothetical protein